MVDLVFTIQIDIASFTRKTRHLKVFPTTTLPSAGPVAREPIGQHTRQRVGGLPRNHDHHNDDLCAIGMQKLALKNVALFSLNKVNRENSCEPANSTESLLICPFSIKVNRLVNSEMC